MWMIKLWFAISTVLRKLLYRCLFGGRVQFHKGAHFRGGFHITVEKAAKIEIGEKCFFNNQCGIHAMRSIRIGRRCLFGEHVEIYDHNHRFRDLSIPIVEQGFRSVEVTIGDDCWIGSNVMILPGASIGNRCVISAGCVIDETIPPNTLVRLVQEKTCALIQSAPPESHS